MRKILLTILVLFLASLNVFALEIVYPKKTPCVINAPSTFFIGSTKPGDKLQINGVDVKVSPLGAFAQVIPLNYGMNYFKIVSSSMYAQEQICPCNEVIKPSLQIVDFVIERPKPCSCSKSPSSLLEYPVMSNFFVKGDNSPLRTTPVDAGVNRMAHLPKDIQLFINGEKGNFYRVFLNSKLSGWIAKANVEERTCDANQTKIDNSPIQLNEFKKKEDNDFYLYEFYLSKKTPFVVKEENGLTLQLFNIAGQPDNTFTLKVPLKKLFGYEASYEGNKFILKVRKLPYIASEKPIRNVKIVIDAGHGGSEYGAIGCCGDKEKDINLAIAKNLEKELNSRGAKTHMTRTSDIDLSLNDRVKFAKDKDAAMLISIHANALPDGGDPIKCKGTSIYYYHNQAKALADSILTSMTIELGTQNDKVRQGSLALVRPTSSVSILIEVAYLINPDDYALLTDKSFQAKCAKAIADGIEKYMQSN